MEKYEVSENSFKYGLINFHEMRPLAENTMKYLIAEANNFKEHYIKLGRHLYEFKNNEYYKDFGFDNFEECINKNLGMDKGSVSRCINVFLKFGSKLAKRNYDDYSYSQQVEMLPLDDEKLSQVTCDMSVKDIRELKKKDNELVVNVATSQPHPHVNQECPDRKSLVKMCAILLGSIDKKFSNVYCTFGVQEFDKYNEIYINVRADSQTLEAGKYALSLRKIKG